MNESQIKQFNKMHETLLRISVGYMEPEELRETCEQQYGLDYEEALEMSYENIKNEAALCIADIKKIA